MVPSPEGGIERGRGVIENGRSHAYDRGEVYTHTHTDRLIHYYYHYIAGLEQSLVNTRSF